MPTSAIDLRIFIYDRVLERGQPPQIVEIAQHFAVSPAEAKQSLADLRIGKTVLRHPETGEVWMAGPFSAVETSYRVTGSRTQWWANCAWDMLGVAVIASESVRIDARCSDCGDAMTLHADPRRPPTENAVVHFLVPARQWYDDIGFT